MAVQRDYFGFAKCFAILFGREEVPFFINSDPKKTYSHQHTGTFQLLVSKQIYILIHFFPTSDSTIISNLQ